MRELSHQTTTVFCDKLGKNLKPFVKSIVPIMVFGESDNYGNVSTAAKDSLMSVFGADKRLTVLTSCSNEILTVSNFLKCSSSISDVEMTHFSSAQIY